MGSAHERTGIPHFDSKWRIEEAVRGLRFPSHVILRPVFFMENLLAPFSLPRHEVRARNGALLSEGVVGGRRPDVRIAP